MGGWEGRLRPAPLVACDCRAGGGARAPSSGGPGPSSCGPGVVPGPEALGLTLITALQGKCVSSSFS